MAALQLRNGVYRLFFQYHGKQQTFTVGEVSADEAHHWKSRAEQLIMRVKEEVLTVPCGVSISDSTANLPWTRRLPLPRTQRLINSARPSSMSPAMAPSNPIPSPRQKSTWTILR